MATENLSNLARAFAFVRMHSCCEAPCRNVRGCGCAEYVAHLLDEAERRGRDGGTKGNPEVKPG